MRTRTNLLLALTAVAVAASVPAAAMAQPADTAQGQVGPAVTSAEPTAATTAQLRAQAAAENLTASQAESLQSTVASVVARTGGTQVAINQVAWDGGDTLVPLPGETHARELGVVSAAGTVHGCAYYQFCTYGTRDYSGMVDRISSCTWHISHGFFTAYVNNQTPGTRARFYDYYRNFVGISVPAFYQDANFGNVLGHQTHYIRPC